jgi:hypothetical protein
VLLGELATIRRVVGMEVEVKEDVEVGVVHSKSFPEPERGPLEDLGEAVGRSTSLRSIARLEGSASTPVISPGPRIAGNVEFSSGPARVSLGETGFSRKSTMILDPRVDVDVATSRPQASAKSTRRKRRKSADAIDDLFQNLD